jgi:signal transduction histidine kinase
VLGRLRGSLRVRLTAAFSLTLLVAGAVVLAGINILVRNGMTYGLGLAESQVNDPHPYGSTQNNGPILTSMQHNLLVKGGGTVFCVWLVATVAIYFIAGRLLTPLRKITVTAELVAARNLHRRIALDEPPGEIKALADSFDSMLDRLDTAFAGQGRFIANAAHELKTPVAVTRTLVEVAMRRRDSSPEVRSLGTNLLAVNAQQEQLIEALLTLARSGSAITERVPVDLATLAATAVNTTAVDADVHVDTSLVTARTMGDPVLLAQMIRNLVDNAMRYNVPGGEVRVETVGRGAGAYVNVANTGPTIAAHEIPALFEPFRRLRDRTGFEGGNGLGLSIVRAVAQAHGGDVTATPRPGGGLEVRVALPRG